MNKTAALEETEVVDPSSGKQIRISTTTRLLYRKAYPQEYGDMRNARLNQAIAKDFASNSGNVLHYFRLGKRGAPRNEHKPEGAEEGKVYGNVAEIRGNASSFFISAIQDDTIDILTIQNSWIKPKYKGSQDKPMAFGDT